MNEIDVKWIFFDIGSTLVNEQVAYDHRAYDMLENTNVSFAEFDAKRIELAKQGFDGNSQAIKHYNLTKTPWHHEDETLYDGVKELLSYLKSKGYKMAIIANQSQGLKDRLQKFEILDYFDVIVSSDDIGVYKPNVAIFYFALKSANCSADQSFMIGDRLDNDIVPAKSVGMKTIWVRHGLSAYQDLRFGEDVVDFAVDCLADIYRIL